MKPLYSVDDIRAVEKAAMQNLPTGTLMRRAGLAAAGAALALLPEEAAVTRVLLLAGPGNNGGDALEAAAHLAAAGAQAFVWMADQAEPGAQGSAERQAALAQARTGTVQFLPGPPQLAAQRPDAGWDLVIDGLFGIGLARPVSGELREVVEWINTLACPVLALDVPSGLDAATGAIVGPDGIALRASHTITFIGDKPGLHTSDGQDHAGRVQVAALEIDPGIFPAARACLNSPALFAGYLRPRRRNSHKGSFGNAIVLGGAQGMVGAPVLAARTALHAGAGRVYIAFAGEGPAYDSMQPELMCRPAAAVDFTSGAVIAGPGLGESHAAAGLLLRALASPGPLLLDADALNLLAGSPELQTALAQRERGAVLTPHPLEAARLLGINAAAVQADRLSAARQLAEQFNATVVLKGSGTVISRPVQDESREAVDIVINTTGNPALATAGTGDVLSGLCGALLAQGWPEWEAALGAVWMHGAAADLLVEKGIGPIGLAAGELIAAIRTTLNRMVREQR
jgi:hydroxyethylthiazole kinase-like uncharacterized protein yjeF